MIAAARRFDRAEWIAGAGALALAATLLRPATSAGIAGLTVGFAVAALALWIALQDLKHYTISDAAVLGLAGIGLASRWSVAARTGEPATVALVGAGVDGLLCGGLLLAFREIYYRLRGFDGLGLGDVKLAAAGALLVGAAGFAWALFAASAAGLLLVAARRRFAPAAPAIERVAFGAALAPAVWAVWVLQQAAPALAPALPGWGS